MGQTQKSNNLDKSRQSFFNEIRGRLLEFSCANELALRSGKFRSFLGSLKSDEIEEFAQYQDYLRSNDERSYNYILRAGQVFCEAFDDNEIRDLKQIILTGKLNQKNIYGEADLYLEGISQKELISIKLIKDNSFINSKSAGIKSIFDKYFRAPDIQAELNLKVEQFFSQFKTEFYQYFDYDLDELTFVELCRLKGISDRPGQLSSDLKELLFRFYLSCIQEIRHNFITLNETSSSLFLQNIFPLAGFSDREMNIFIFSHDKCFSQISMKNYGQSELETSSLKISEVCGNTSFNIELDRLILQIRVKPMNSFLAPSMKVNCSVKFKGEAH